MKEVVDCGRVLDLLKIHPYLLHQTLELSPEFVHALISTGFVLGCASLT